MRRRDHSSALRAGCGATLLAASIACADDAAPKPREIVHAQDGSLMMLVPATQFRMGTGDEGSHPNLPAAPVGAKPLRPYDVLLARAESGWRHAEERPQHTVRLDAFVIDRYEVTNAQYRKFVDEIARTSDHDRCHADEPEGKDHTPRYWGAFNPLLEDTDYARTAPFSSKTFTADEKPVVGVDWFDAYAYAAWAGKRLPSEAEWELAARGSDARRWPWGSRWRSNLANVGGEKRGQDVGARGFEKDGYIYAAPIGTYPKGRSPYGVDDMAGNVAEWCADWFRRDYYATSPAGNPHGPPAGTARAVRGGSSQNFASRVRTAAREAREPEFRTFTLGFRCAKDG